jgi:hypothetical protein
MGMAITIYSFGGSQRSIIMLGDGKPYILFVPPFTVKLYIPSKYLNSQLFVWKPQFYLLRLATLCR